ncbi:hypothetical protein B0F90DRAFT_1153501 [Multifurca ochricompacta]|uniref:Uncharacterized protein n=1 Tax=Multifurca ochricompacta TaxID=376703 RepID=A0AAD4M0X3_9AGAM|nr:hypothetical protein B0F90DRAFT_1153501 [Multifurca ochricompacta]
MIRVLFGILVICPPPSPISIFCVLWLLFQVTRSQPGTRLELVVRTHDCVFSSHNRHRLSLKPSTSARSGLSSLLALGLHFPSCPPHIVLAFQLTIHLWTLVAPSIFNSRTTCRDPPLQAPLPFRFSTFATVTLNHQRM